MDLYLIYRPYNTNTTTPLLVQV